MENAPTYDITSRGVIESGPVQEAPSALRPKLSSSDTTVNYSGITRLIIAVATLALLLSRTSLAAADTADFKPSASYRVLVQSIYENDETEAKNNTFKIRRARVQFGGKPAPALSGHMTIETIDDDGVILLQGYGTYSFDTALNLQAGQMLVPFGLESRRSFTKREFYSRSEVIDQVTRDMGRRPANARDARFRDIGVMFFGSIPYAAGLTIGYQVMVMNGNGILTGDDNDRKDAVVRATVSMPFGVEFGGSVYNGTFEGGDTVGLNLTEEAYGAEVVWTGKMNGYGFRLQSEYVQARYEKADGGHTRPRGFYIYGTLLPIPALEVSLRYGQYEPDFDARPKNIRRRTTAAVRYDLGRGSLVTGDYEFRDRDAGDVGNRLILQFLVIF